MSGSGAMALRRRAMDLLARREHSRCELARRLRDRFPEADAESVEEVLVRLAGENLQSDRRFAEEYVRMRMRRGFGWLHIRADLQSRGVDADIIAGLSPPEDEWLALAENLVASRLRGQVGLAPGSRDHQRLFRFMLSRGFPADIARKSLQNCGRFRSASV
ncbi:MAG: regulatory protein RecX [Gammaproteobacteria bacterium]|nr:regulatory protein RecX [Gammaproteobacteria bacterium]